MSMIWLTLLASPAIKLFAAMLTRLGPGTVVNSSGIPYLIGYLASHLNKIFYAVWFYQSLVMDRMMNTPFHDLQIIFAVVVTYSVYMVNNFIRLYFPIKRFTHYKNMLTNISPLISIGVFGRKNKYIPCSGSVSAAFPSWIGFLYPRSFWSSHIISINEKTIIALTGISRG